MTSTAASGSRPRPRGRTGSRRVPPPTATARASTATSRSPGALTVHSLVRGPWELRLVRADALASTAAAASSSASAAGRSPATRPQPTSTALGAVVSTERLRSGIRSVLGDGTAATASRRDASPLGADAVVPYLDHPLAAGEWVATLVELSGAPAATSARRLRLARRARRSDHGDRHLARRPRDDESPRRPRSRLTHGPAPRRGPDDGSLAITKE